MSDESFDDLLSGLDEPEAAPPAKKKRAPRKPKPKPPSVLDAIKQQEEALRKEKQEAIDSASERAPDTRLPGQGPKETWPVIEIDEMPGAPNFEFVSLNDVAFQIKRGEPVAVPPAILAVLQNAVSARIVQTRDPVTGGMRNKLQRYPTVPYRIVKWDK